MLATVAAANIKKVQIKKYSVFIYSEAEPHAMYAINEQTRTLCVLQELRESCGGWDAINILHHILFEKQSQQYLQSGQDISECFSCDRIINIP